MARPLQFLVSHVDDDVESWSSHARLRLQKVLKKSRQVLRQAGDYPQKILERSIKAAPAQCS